MIFPIIIIISIIISRIAGINTKGEKSMELEEAIELKGEIDIPDLKEQIMEIPDEKEEIMEIPDEKEEMRHVTKENYDDEIEIPNESAPINEIRTIEPLLEIRKDNFYCAFCRVHFRFAKHYENHFSNRHPNEKAFSCPICPYLSDSRRCLIYHVDKYHSNEVNVVLNYDKSRLLWCALCDLEIKGTMVFEKHALTVHKGMKMMECSQCEMKYFRYNALAYHKRKKHSRHDDDGDNFTCKFCKNVFYRSDELIGHEIHCENRHPKKKIEAVADRINEKHFESAKLQNECHACGKKFLYSTRLKAHLEECHPQAAKAIFPCVYCKKAYTTSAVLNKHLDKYHAEINENPPMRRRRKDRVYKCEYCSSEFPLVNLLETHVKNEHPGKKLFRCASCGLRYKFKQTLLRHLKVMHGRPYLTCGYCDVSFAITSELHIHEKRCRERFLAAGNQKEFYCDICRRTLPGTLKSHKRNHEDYDQCPFCDKRFHRLRKKRGIRHHLMSRHSNKVDNAAFSRVVEIIRHGVEDGVNDWKRDVVEELMMEEEEFVTEKDGNNETWIADIKEEFEDDESLKEELEEEECGEVKVESSVNMKDETEVEEEFNVVEKGNDETRIEDIKKEYDGGGGVEANPVISKKSGKTMRT